MQSRQHYWTQRNFGDKLTTWGRFNIALGWVRLQSRPYQPNQRNYKIYSNAGYLVLVEELLEVLRVLSEKRL